MIKGVICDLDGVYFKNGKENFIKEIIKRYNINRDLVETVFFSSEKMNLYKKGKIDDNSYWQYFIDTLKIKSTEEELITILTNGYEVDKSVVSLVEKLKANDLETIICSNNFKARINALEEKYDFLKNFSIQVFSYEIGYLKLENNKLFDEVLKLSKLAKDEILLFDNGAANVAYAKQYGFAAVLYKDFLTLADELKSYGIDI